MTCPECGMKMLSVPTGTVFMSNPPIIVEQWCCGCGFKGEKHDRRCISDGEVFMKAWRRWNGLEEVDA